MPQRVMQIVSLILAVSVVRRCDLSDLQINIPLYTEGKDIVCQERLAVSGKIRYNTYSSELQTSVTSRYGIDSSRPSCH